MVFGTQSDFFLNTFSLLYLIAAGVFCWILVWSRNIRKNPAIPPFQILLVLFIIWSLDYSLFSFTKSLNTWILLELAAYPSYAMIPVFLFILSWQYTGHQDILRCRWAPVMFIIPAITILFAWIPGWQSLLMSNFYIDTSGFFPVLEYEYGIWAYVHIANNAIFTFGSVVFLVNSLYTHPNIRRKGIKYLIYGIIVYSIWNILYMTGLIPLWAFFLPIPILLIGICIAIAIFRYNALDFLPMARTIILEQISDLFLILSVDNHVVDINPSMADAFDINIISSSGAHISKVFSEWPDFVSICMESYEKKQTYSYKKGGEIKSYAVRKSAINDSEGIILGNVLILHDISDIESALGMLATSNEELKSINTLLQDQINERKSVEERLSIVNEKLNLLTVITRHDILNVVTALRGYLDLSVTENPDEPVHSYLKHCNELTEMIESQIKFTQIYDNIGIHAPTWQYLQEVIQKVRNNLPTGDLSYHVHLDGLMINADPLFEKVIFTLVENTIRHGQSATEVWFFSIQEGDRLQFIYEDNGVGVETEEKERIFDRGVGKNTGLGLFLSRDILAITGLSIRETGEKGKGARFEIAIPDGAWKMRTDCQ